MTPPRHIHFLGICGTFMGGAALLAREAGYTVSGCDSGVYPPMSELLREQGITVLEGYDPAHLEPAPDLVVVGNVMKRGLPIVEALLDRGLPYTSGPAFLADYLLPGRWTLAVAGTHGKTTTSAMLAKILDHAGLAPGFLIGGAPRDFAVSARLGQTPFFVVEADEYDSAFFDKRSKFVHYRPRTLVINNIEFDHADIFDDLAAIRRQFHHLVRTVPGSGKLIVPTADAEVETTLAMGCWSERERFAPEPVAQGWGARLHHGDGSAFSVLLDGAPVGEVAWAHTGRHNVANALAAIAAARHVGVAPEYACAALSAFLGVKRRMEVRGEVRGVTVYDDFAHHPTAIRTTLEGLRRRVGSGRIVVLFEPRSNTMRMGVHRTTLAAAFAAADRVLLHAPSDLGWSIDEVVAALDGRGAGYADVASLAREAAAMAQAGDHLVVMSNGGFGGLHERLLEALQ